MGDKARMALAEQKALGVHLLHPEACPFPVNPVRVANALGFAVCRDDAEDGRDGAWNAGERTLCLNLGQSVVRRRIALCRLLGHALMGHRPPDGASDAERAEAEAFAECLLMPAEEVWRSLRQGMDFGGLVRHFGVSERTMAERLTKLGWVSGKWRRA